MIEVESDLDIELERYLTMSITAQKFKKVIDSVVSVQQIPALKKYAELYFKANPTQDHRLIERYMKKKIKQINE